MIGVHAGYGGWMHGMIASKRIQPDTEEPKPAGEGTESGRGDSPHGGSTESGSGFFMRWRTMFGIVGSIPFAFLGVGIYRAWLATFFRYEVFPTIGFADYAMFEGAIAAVSFALAFTAKRVVPLWSNRAASVATAVSLTGGSVLIVLDCFFLATGVVKVVGLVLAGGGLGALILMWAEFYGSLNPMRVALYHALAIMVGCAIKWVFMGLSAPYLAFFAIVLPLVSFAQVQSSMKRLPERDLPRKYDTAEGTAEFPWKPVLLMAACTFACGFGTLPMQTIGPGNTLGVLLVTALVVVGVLSESKWFNFDTIYQLAFPLSIIAFLFVAPSMGANSMVMAVCYDAGYTMLSMFMMLVLSNITYRFGISAVWINGIERGIRYLVEIAGWALSATMPLFASSSAISGIYTVIALVMIVVFVAVSFTERGLSAKWGVSLHDGGSIDGAMSASRLAMRVSDVSKEHDLTPREEEVLQLLARRESPSQIEKNLYVARGTLKAHISHIYRKLDVHSRDELFEMLEGDFRRRGCSGDSSAASVDG